MNKWITLLISAISDFAISAGGAYCTVASAGNAVPSEAQIAVAVVTGIVQAARGVQKALNPPPG